MPRVKADVTGEETGKRTLSATVVGVQASEDRYAGITLGKDHVARQNARVCRRSREGLGGLLCRGAPPISRRETNTKRRNKTIMNSPPRSKIAARLFANKERGEAAAALGEDVA
jgi:hypothetical protein